MSGTLRKDGKGEWNHHNAVIARQAVGLAWCALRSNSPILANLKHQNREGVFTSSLREVGVFAQSSLSFVIARQAVGLAWQSILESSLRENPQGFSWQSKKRILESLDSMKSLESF